MFYTYSQDWRDTAKCDKVAIAQNVSSLTCMLVNTSWWSFLSLKCIIQVFSKPDFQNIMHAVVIVADSFLVVDPR